MYCTITVCRLNYTARKGTAIREEKIRKEVQENNSAPVRGRVQMKCDGTWRRTGGEVRGKLANGVGSQYSSQFLGTRCIQHYYR